ncbi:MAG TPA: PEP/pyruvate-binding domain-containing protein [Gaiellaceae bacterium]|nr:PEP/pyruvate-binding domain-containing protein [Gaiellaceae bacterium]
MTYCRPLHELRRSDIAAFGGKSAMLGELIEAGIPVPPGFAVSATAFRASGVTGDTDAIRNAPIPDDVRDEVSASYAALGEDVPVAVRSSALDEDAEDATFAGQQETILWVRGADAVCEAMRECWASLFSAPAAAYRERLGHTDPAMGVTVQEMVDAEVSGVLFTCNPVSGDPSMVAINASWGLGLAVVGGEVTPDDYLVSKVTREVVRTTVSSKAVEYVHGEDGAVSVEVDADRRDAPCLDDARLAQLVDVGIAVERYFGSRQDIEWAFDREGVLHVLQARPVTALPQRGTTAPSSAMAMVMAAFGVGEKK